MTISESNIRIAVTIDKELKKQLEAEAKKQNRSLSNFIVTILKDYMNKEAREQ